MMVQFGKALSVLSVCAALAACAPQPQKVQQREDLLASAGFQVVPADTPERAASLATLPANRFTRQTRDGVQMVIYADPTVCNCLYMGDAAAYSKYRSLMRAANRQAAEESSANVAKMDWGAWPAFGP